MAVDGGLEKRSVAAFPKKGYCDTGLFSAGEVWMKFRMSSSSSSAASSAWSDDAASDSLESALK